LAKLDQQFQRKLTSILNLTAARVKFFALRESLLIVPGVIGAEITAGFLDSQEEVFCGGALLPFMRNGGLRLPEAEPGFIPGIRQYCASYTDPSVCELLFELPFSWLPVRLFS
jgi:hypothetical protein